jgi:hypothetical protein
MPLSQNRRLLHKRATRTLRPKATKPTYIQIDDGLTTGDRQVTETA